MDRYPEGFLSTDALREIYSVPPSLVEDDGLRQMHNAIQAYAGRDETDQPPTGSLVDEVYVYIWRTFEHIAGTGTLGGNIRVPKCVFSNKELREAHKSGDMPIYIPPEVVNPKRPYILIKTGLSDLSLERIHQVNSPHQYGWLLAEKSTKPAFFQKKQEDFLDYLKKGGREGMAYPTYLILRKIGRLFADRYIDQGYRVRLPGSTYYGHTFEVCMQTDEGELKLVSGIDPSPEQTYYRSVKATT